ncbi:hypothetical protein C1752_10465 [Acaryochloris thomasi RCC1774]|uniref:Uncharacterized protein n=1 Tax=Acaryochloris thomasi RCC1774 TaxID=1764569 RepID=A0A2W1JG41_9CYAN|nr:hypothetical protein [Acaryochloris thomasi]PZD70615.1 hypothetical protein C1752_10465 [Acaryochloris thomasi RCC1774]
MTAATPDRLDRIEAMIESLANTSANLLQATSNQDARMTRIEQAHESRLEKIETSLLGLTEIAGIMAKETRQLKRTMDYLLSHDGERS